MMRGAHLIILFRLGHVSELFRTGLLVRQCIFSGGHWYSPLFSRRSSPRDRESSFQKWLDSFSLFEQIYQRLGEEPRHPYSFPITLSQDFCLNEQGMAGAAAAPLKGTALVRVIDTIITPISALLEFDFDISLDRTSMQPLENFFGLLRRLVHDCNRFDHLLHATGNNYVVQYVLDQLAHSRDI
jgi:hypothetical protein